MCLPAAICGGKARGHSARSDRLVLSSSVQVSRFIRSTAELTSFCVGPCPAICSARSVLPPCVSMHYSVEQPHWQNVMSLTAAPVCRLLHTHWPPVADPCILCLVSTDSGKFACCMLMCCTQCDYSVCFIYPDLDLTTWPFLAVPLRCSSFLLCPMPFSTSTKGDCLVVDCLVLPELTLTLTVFCC